MVFRMAHLVHLISRCRDLGFEANGSREEFQRLFSINYAFLGLFYL